MIERLIGTMMTMVHELPGTTFSNTVERGGYDSEAKAVLTLGGRTPAGVWAERAAVQGAPATVTNETAFLVDFLPVVRRRLSRTGFTVDHVQYYADVLRPLIARREQLGRFVLRRDPRDISRIWALHPETGEYLEVPYRTWSRPAISVWEHSAAVARLREQGRAEIDENALFSMVEQMRAITDTAAAASRKARRTTARHTAVRARRPAEPEPPPATPPAAAQHRCDRSR
ncbi:Mu transposase C-terminal domain-containing protein [Nocardia xishanensis]|uniref:Mu transposase C-terminal domain-containing protein n=1 Tax=Nocardia xishanensis TaxID=238964 RepID=UPI00082C8D42